MNSNPSLAASLRFLIRLNGSLPLMIKSTTAFDAAAHDYDREFAHTAIGRYLRRAVHEELTWVGAGTRLLDLGGGTGEDALWAVSRGSGVTIVDASEAMLANARDKAREVGADSRIEFHQLDLNACDLSQRFDAHSFEGVLLNFGVYNCIADGPRLARTLGRLTKQGGYLTLVVMSPVCPWEIIWHLLRLCPRDAFRRLRRNAAVRIKGGQDVSVRYPTPRAVRREFEGAFDFVSLRGVGACVPPPYLNRIFERHPGMLRGLSRCEGAICHWFPWTWMNDHYLMSMVRR